MAVNGSGISINGLLVGAIPLSNNLLFSPGSTYNIGASGANTPLNVFVGNQLSVAGASGLGAAPSATTYINLAAGITAASTMRFTQGVAPTSPVDGDVWREDNTNTGLKIRINGVTKSVTVA